MLISFCLLWFRQVFRHPIYERLVDQPSYWFATGILFYVAVQLPALFFTAHAARHGHAEIADDLFSANNYALVISYILYGIGMVWRGSRGYQRRIRPAKRQERFSVIE